MAQTITMNDVRSVKGRGYLHNKGTDTFSARIVTVNGRISSEQARKLADIADTYGNGKLTFTTRLSVEMPGIPFAKIDAFEAAIKAIGLSVGGTEGRELLDELSALQGVEAVEPPHLYDVAVGEAMCVLVVEEDVIAQIVMVHIT